MRQEMTEFGDGSGISWTVCNKQSAPRCRQITTPTPHHSIFTDRMFFLTSIQQCQSTKGLCYDKSLRYIFVPSVLWHCWLGGRKGNRPVKTEWWGAGVVICLERGADLHMAQLMPLPLTVSCFSKIQIGFTFLVPAHTRVVLDKGPLNGCIYLCKSVRCVCSA